MSEGKREVPEADRHIVNRISVLDQQIQNLTRQRDNLTRELERRAAVRAAEEEKQNA